MFEPYQVAEARAWGADCILIIMAAVDDCLRQGPGGRGAARSAWTCWSRCTTSAELDRALKLQSRLIGINNRDLKMFETSLAASERLAPQGARRQA